MVKVVILMGVLVGGISVQAESLETPQPVRLGKKFGFVDGRGTLVVAAHFDWAWPYSEERAGVRVGRDWFLLDLQGKRVCHQRYDWVGCFGSGLAPARLGRKWGYIGRDGE